MARRKPSRVFSVRLSGKDIAPGLVRSHEIADVLNAVEEAIASLAYSRALIESKRDDLIVGLSEINAGSLRMTFASPEDGLVHQSFMELAETITSERASLLPPAVLRALKRVSAFTKRHEGGSAEFRSVVNDSVIFRLFAMTEIPDPVSLKGETTVYGRVLRVGGRTPKVMIDTGKRNLTCEISKSMAVTLGHRLYDTVSLRGIATWDPEQFNIEHFQVTGINDFEDVSPREAFSELSKAFGKHFADVDDVSSFSRNLRRGDKEED